MTYLTSIFSRQFEILSERFRRSALKWVNLPSICIWNGQLYLDVKISCLSKHITCGFACDGPLQLVQLRNQGQENEIHYNFHHYPRLDSRSPRRSFSRWHQMEEGSRKRGTSGIFFQVPIWRFCILNPRPTTMSLTTTARCPSSTQIHRTPPPLYGWRPSAWHMAPGTPTCNTRDRTNLRNFELETIHDIFLL